MKALPHATYHVFFDNLFSTPPLFRRLREEGFGATGTARLNSGFYQPYVKAKRADKAKAASKFKFNQIKTTPTEDNKVSQVIGNLFVCDLQCWCVFRLTRLLGEMASSCFSLQQSSRAPNLNHEGDEIRLLRPHKIRIKERLLQGHPQSAYYPYYHGCLQRPNGSRRYS